MFHGRFFGLFEQLFIFADLFMVLMIVDELLSVLWIQGQIGVENVALEPVGPTFPTIGAQWLQLGEPKNEFTADQRDYRHVPEQVD